LRGSSRRSSSTTLTTSRVWVPRDVARLVVWLIVDYFALRRLVRRASGCLGTSLSSSSTTSPTPRVRVPQHVARLVAPLVVDYFAYAARLGASAHRAARHAARHQRLRAPQLRLAATLALLQPHRASRLLVSRQH
jgi:hypothetical protein